MRRIEQTKTCNERESEPLLTTNFNGIRCATGNVMRLAITSRENKEKYMETRTVNADDIRSAILNCICPECGGVIELETSELKCLGRCGKRWRDIWVRTQLHLQARKARRSSSPRRTTGAARVSRAN